MATYGLLHPKYILGINAGCRGRNLYRIDGNLVAYPAGNTIVLYDNERKTQQYLHGVEKVKGITAFTISPNKLYAAVAQIGEQKPSITIFDLKANKRRKSLINNDMLSKEYISLAFTADSKNLATLTGPPEFVVNLWKWDRSRLLCQVKASLSGPMYEITTSPIDVSILCAIGKGTFKFYRYNEGHLKPFGYAKGESTHFLCHAWLGKGDKMIAGTSEGRLMYFERAEYRFEIKIPVVERMKRELATAIGREKVPGELPEGFNANIEDLFGVPTTAKRTKEKIDSSIESSLGLDQYEGKEITAATAFSKGFVISFGTGNVVVYEEQSIYETPEDHYKPIHVIRIPNFSSESHDRVVKSLVLNSTEEVILATTISCQLFEFVLANAEIMQPKDMIFDFANSSFHFGAIVALDVAVRKSLFVTVGADQFIRVWNYATMSLEVSKEFEDEIFSISLHPTGLFLLAGCTDKVRLFTILMNDIKELREFKVRACHVCAFSNGGHLFAIVNSNVVLVFTTTLYEHISILRGHGNKIRSLKWTPDDTKLVSVGADGSIFEWDVMTGHRESDFVERASNLLDVAISPDAKTHFAVSGNKLIKEIQIQDGILLKEVDLAMEPTCITISHTGKALIAGMADGVVRSFRQPLTYTNEWFDFRMHHESINAIRVTYEEANCISVSEDGSIVIWKLTDAEGRVSKLEKDILFSTEVLISKAKLDEIDSAMKEMRDNFGEIRLRMEDQNKHKEVAYREEIKELNQIYSDEINKKRTLVEDLIELKQAKDAERYANAADLAKESKENIRKLEEKYNNQLYSEFLKYGELQNMLAKTVKDYESRLFKMDDERNSSIDDLTDYYQEKIAFKADALIDVCKDSLKKNKECAEIRRLIEEDTNTELLHLTNNYETKLKVEKELNAKLKNESKMMKKTYTSMQKEIDEQKFQVTRLVGEAEKMKTVIGLTDKEVVSLKKELVDRDINVQGKEKIISDLKSTNNELEKFKFVLDYKIKELKKMIEPKEREIIYLKKQNADMQDELGTTVGVRNGLELQVDELTNKLRVCDQELAHEKALRHKLELLIGRIRNNLCTCMEILDDHKALQKIVKTMYDKYGHSLKVGRAQNTEQETICDLANQKNHLELSLNSMKLKMKKDVSGSRNDRLKSMNENTLLLNEINNLRREWKMARDRVEVYEKVFKITPEQKPDPVKIKKKLLKLIAQREKIEAEHNKELEAKDNLIEAQQYEMETLTSKILKIQDFVNDARSDAPPVDFLKQIFSDH